MRTLPELLNEAGIIIVDGYIGAFEVSNNDDHIRMYSLSTEQSWTFTHEAIKMSEKSGHVGDAWFIEGTYRVLNDINKVHTKNVFKLGFYSISTIR